MQTFKLESKPALIQFHFDFSFWNIHKSDDWISFVRLLWARLKIPRELSFECWFNFYTQETEFEFNELNHFTNSAENGNKFIK